MAQLGGEGEPVATRVCLGLPKDLSQQSRRPSPEEHSNLPPLWLSWPLKVLPNFFSAE